MISEQDADRELVKNGEAGLDLKDLYEKLDLKGNAWDRRIYQEVIGI